LKKLPASALPTGIWWLRVMELSIETVSVILGMRSWAPWLPIAEFGSETTLAVR